MAQTATRPRKGEQLEAEIDSLAFGGRGVARLDGYVVFVSGGLPGDRVRAEITKPKKRFAEARAVELLRPGADRVANRCEHEGQPCPGAPWQGLDYERQLVEKRSQVDEALRRIGDLDGFELEEIEPALEQWRYRNKLEYSFGPGEDGTLLGFHASGRWDLVIGVEDCLLASERGNAARNAVREWARDEGRRPLRPPRRHGHALQPRGARRAPHRADPDAPRHHTEAHPQAAGRPAHGGRRRLGRQRRADRRARRGAAARAALRARFRDVAQRLLPDQHRDGRAPLRDRRRVRGAERRRAALRPLLRDRHDRADDGGAGGRGLGAGDRPRGDRRRRAEREAQRDRERPLRRRQRAHRRAAAARGGGQARRRPARPAARRPLAEDRPPRARVRGAADRLRLLQPDDAGAERGAAGRGGLYPAPREAGRHVPPDAAHRVRGCGNFGHGGGGA